MLNQLTAKQISEQWDLIKVALEKSLPPIIEGSANRITNIFNSLLLGELQCWIGNMIVVNSEQQNELVPYGVLITEIITDRCSDVRNILIYAIYSAQGIPNGEYQEGYNTIKTFAKANGCCRIMAYTNSKAILNIVQAFGGATDFHFVTLPI